jgi:hypothetical protein
MLLKGQSFYKCSFLSDAPVDNNILLLIKNEIANNKKKLQ